MILPCVGSKLREGSGLSTPDPPGIKSADSVNSDDSSETDTSIPYCLTAIFLRQRTTVSSRN